MLFKRLRNFMSSRKSNDLDMEHYNTYDMSSFIYDNQDVIFHFRPYKQVYTPYEVEKAFSDETMFEDTIYGRIIGAVDLGYDYLLEIKVVYVDADGCVEESNKTEYIHLGQCKMTLYENLEEGVES